MATMTSTPQRPDNTPLSQYLKTIRLELERSLCLRNFASQIIERHNKPEVEIRSSKELLLEPVIIQKNAEERIQIEPSINSTRISIRVKQSDEMEVVLVDRFSRFIEQRAEEFGILRRVSVEGYDLSFLVCNLHLEEMRKQKLIDFLLYFLEEINSEVNTLKLNVNSRARVVATTFLQQFI